MFKKFASDALGLSDIGKIIAPEDFDKADADDFVLSEEGEKIYFLIKSQQDEYCFTNLGLIHVDGVSATNKKRMLRRFEYYYHPITNVLLETAGNIDKDVELKFNMGGTVYSIDVDKNQLDELKPLYKSLFVLSSRLTDNNSKFDISVKSLRAATELAGSGKNNGLNSAEEFEKVHTYIKNFILEYHDEYSQKDFSDIFEKFITL